LCHFYNDGCTRSTKRNALVGANLCVRPHGIWGEGMDGRTRNRAHTQVRPYGVSSSLSPVRDFSFVNFARLAVSYSNQMLLV
jgi:hypothetical protein